jgi:hypothetical protein
MTTNQGRGVTQAVAFDAATVGGAWVGVWGSIGELGGHYMCEVRFGSVLRFQLGVKKPTLLPKMKMYVCMNVHVILLYYMYVCTHGSTAVVHVAEIGIPC